MLNRLFDLVEANWHKRLVAYPAIVAASVAVLYFLVTGALALEFGVALGVALVVLVAGTTFHHFSTRLPKNPREFIGVAFAIAADDKAERALVQSDFVGMMRRTLIGSTPGRFNVIELPDRIARALADPTETQALMEETNSHFLVYGDARKGKEGGKEWHALRLTCVVRHAQLEVGKSRALSAEMREILPPKMLIDCENDLREFELRSSQYADGARLVIATAALISGERKLAIGILEALRGDFDGLRARASAVNSRLPEIVKKRLWNCYIVEAKAHHARWRFSRDRAALEAVEGYLEKANELEPNTPDYLISKAICEFVLRGDVSKAEQYVQQCGKMVPQDATWRYSIAFLEAYKGNLQSAYKYYRQAFNAREAPDTSIEVEEFLMWVLEREPDKIQLHYCLGIINFRSKGDLVQARSDFDQFLSLCPRGTYVENCTAARRYVAQIDEKLRQAA